MKKGHLKKKKQRIASMMKVCEESIDRLEITLRHLKEYPQHPWQVDYILKWASPKFWSTVAEVERLRRKRWSGYDLEPLAQWEQSDKTASQPDWRDRHVAWKEDMARRQEEGMMKARIRQAELFAKVKQTSKKKTRKERAERYPANQVIKPRQPAGPRKLTPTEQIESCTHWQDVLRVKLDIDAREKKRREERFL
jgi:hypothetical protein